MIKRYSDSKKPGKSLFIALGVCVLAVAIAAVASYSTIGSTTDISSGSSSSVEENEVALNLDKKVESTATATDTNASETSLHSSEKASSTNTSKSEATETRLTEADTQKVLFVYPASNTVTKPYSNGELVYSLTMNDWRAHNGTDFAADAGSSVKAIADGMVKEIKNDQSYGKTVVIEHPNGITAYYSGLADTLSVQENENVVVGKEIGTIKSVPCEIIEENHLHLSVMQNGEYIDPMSLFEDTQEESESE